MWCPAKILPPPSTDRRGSVDSTEKRKRTLAAPDMERENETEDGERKIHQGRLAIGESIEIKRSRGPNAELSEEDSSEWEE